MTDKAICCRYRLPSPQAAGCGDDIDVETGEVRRTAADVLKEWAERYPHLRPCPLINWNWTYRTRCQKCRHAVRES